jgi:hypothetical protein
VPPSIANFTDQYVLDENPFLRFERSWLSPSRTQLTVFDDLYRFYSDWCQREDVEPMAKNGFARALSKSRYPEKRVATSGGRLARARYVVVNAEPDDVHW